ncbi:MAG TPA: hypothetical protein PLO06_05620 [Methanoregulaceae archaeon]|nr:hypothetical protein [Methanoregulaceae archaeon]
MKRETDGSKTLDFRAVGLGVVFLLIILGVTFYAHSITWDDGANLLMTAFTGGAGLFFGSVFGESVAA